MVKWLAVLVALPLVACQGNHSEETEQGPWVKTQTISAGQGVELALTGSIRAQYETAVAFRVGGQIVERSVKAGETVKKGQALFRQDPSDNAAQLTAASAERSAAASARDIARHDAQRQRDLFGKGFVSKQQLERAELSEREAETRYNAASARWQQAQNASQYNVLRAPFAGVVVDVQGEPGQVVAAGTPVAVIAQQGDREVEVSFPDRVQAPKTGRLQLSSGEYVALNLREISGALDPMSRTWQARYVLADPTQAPALGTVVSTRFALPNVTEGTIEVPLGALDERGAGAQIWQVVDGKAQPLPAKIVLLSTETARIQAELSANAKLIVLGTHLLKPGMAVRELPE